MDYTNYSTNKVKQIELYEAMLLPRMIEEKMLLLLRQGRITKWFSGIGQEAIAVGATMALEQAEIVFPMHRNLGVFTTKGIPLHRLFCQWQGRQGGFTKGRDRSFHFGSLEHSVVGMISHLGAQLSLADGVALAHTLEKEQAVTLAFTGEGGTSEGEFHEALNVAAVWSLPVIFLIENNGYGLSTPVSEQYAAAQLADRGIGYGMESLTIDGNHILEVYETIDRLAKSMRQHPRPILIECMTFRMRGHEEASGVKYVPQELMQTWAEKDPIAQFELYLLQQDILSQSEIDHTKENIKAHIQSELELAYQAKPITSTIAEELKDVYAPIKLSIIEPQPTQREARFIDAISEGLDQAMAKHNRLVLMGQDIADYGGVFKITDGFTQKYGKARVRNTPICESAIIGAALGLSLKGYKSMVEMQFSDFVTCGFNQIVNNLAKLHYRWGENADVVIRMPCGGSVNAGPFHSQTNEAWFTHVPGLKVVYPSTVQDAKGLLLAAIDDPNPVLYFEHKALYRSMTGQLPEAYYHTEIGKARLAQEGEEVSIITYGLGVIWAEQLVAEEDISADILDLRSLCPLDYQAIDKTVQKTNKVLILHEDNLFGGIGGELSAYINEHLFEYLDGPVTRVASIDSPIPFTSVLESSYLANHRLKDKLSSLLAY